MSMITQGRGIMRSIGARGQYIYTVHLNGRLLGRSPSGSNESKVVNGGWFVGLRDELSGVTRVLIVREGTSRADAVRFAESALRETMDARGFHDTEWTIQY